MRKIAREPRVLGDTCISSHFSLCVFLFIKFYFNVLDCFLLFHSTVCVFSWSSLVHSYLRYLNTFVTAILKLLSYASGKWLFLGTNNIGLGLLASGGGLVSCLWFCIGI